VKAFTFDLAKGADLLVIEATAYPEVSGDALEREVAAEVDALLRDGVSDAEVERAVALIETQYVTSMQSAGERADKLSMFATYTGDPSLVNEQVDRYRTVTAQGVTRFIHERLGADNRASLLYVPRAAMGTGNGELGTDAEPVAAAGSEA
jgi:predicted Zn-dependent peptidase